MIRLLFPGDPLAPRRPDPDYEAEVAAAAQLGFAWSTIHLEAMLEAEDLERALRFLPQLDDAEIGVYRGWMVRPERYSRLYAALLDRGITLVNTPEQYRHAHYLPESYDVIRNWTAATVWLPCGADVQMDAVHALLQPFGDRPVILKDWVKSRKHEWHEACFIPSAADSAAVERVVRRFIQLQGPDLAEGLVFREFLPLESIGTHSRRAMPLSREYRLFYLDGELLAMTDYWDEGEFRSGFPPEHLFMDVAVLVRSRFFTMDLARRTDGTWMIVELGDAQVAGLPGALDAETFYRALRGRLAAHG